MKKNNQKELKRFLIKQEKKELFGIKKINIICLSVVFLVSVLSIAFASASLKYLEYKMDDRFVNCIDIYVDQEDSKGYDELKTFLTDNANLGIESIEPVYLPSGKFKDVNGNFVKLDGRSCFQESPILYDIILSEQNLVEGKKCQDSLSDMKMVLIVSGNGLEKLGLDTSAAFLEFYNPNDPKHPFAIPIYAIVNDLPDMCDFIATDIYCRHRFIGFDISNDNQRLCICMPDSIKADILERVSRDNLSVSYNKPYDMSHSNKYSKLIVKMQSVDMEHYDSLYYMKMYDSLYNAYTLDYKGIARVYDFSFPDSVQRHEPRILSCFFKKDSLLENVEIFKQQLWSEVNYSIDMNKIYSLKNLNSVKKMVLWLSLGVIGISIIFLCVFLYFLLRSHFQKIQMNLGTFKAFGISNGVLIKIYVCLMFRMTILAFAVAFLLLIIIASICAFFSSIEQGYPYFNVWAWQNFLLLGLAIVASIITTWAVSYGLLKHTPGDLIYDRVGKNQNKSTHDMY